jgi:hypothetical protein
MNGRWFGSEENEMENVDLEVLRNDLARIAGRVTANEFALKLLLATHPDRKTLKKCWEHWLPENIDTWMSQPGYVSIKELRDGIHDQLTQLFNFLDFDLLEDGKHDEGEGDRK